MSLADVLDVAARHYRNSIRTRRRAQKLAQREWATFDVSSPERSWDRDGLGRALVRILAGGKVSAAEQSNPYLNAVLEAGGWLGSPPVGRVVPDVFGRESADGRELDEVLLQPVLDTMTARRSGLSPDRARAVGAATLDRIVGTEVADAGRSADQVASVARPQVVGYVRLLTPPSCGRCAILAGKFYRWNEGFERHPNCDCRHVPAAEVIDGQAIADPAEAVRAGLVRGLSEADRRAILDGADPAQVINAHDGMYTADGVKFTRSGTTRRGLAGRRLGRSPRMRPEAIYRQADSREEALDLLYRNGYII